MKYRHHKYTYSRPFLSPRHDWSLVGPQGAINFWMSIYQDEHKLSENGGLETHYFTPPGYMINDAPSHFDCPYAGGRCWHDGTSLYASETLWPMIKPMLKMGDHDSIFRLLEGEANRIFKLEEEET